MRRELPWCSPGYGTSGTEPRLDWLDGSDCMAAIRSMGLLLIANM
jgi:hypothetical protein